MESTSSRLQRPNVYAAEDYREFLRQFYHYEKHRSDAFSYRAFSARAGFRSPNFLKLVIEGQRNLTLKSVRGIVRALNLNSEEARFFKNLVLYGQAKTSSDRAQYVHEMYKSRVFRDLYPIKQAELSFYENWYCIPIREMVAAAEFREDPIWIARQLRPAISAAQASQALKVLLLLGLIRREPDGRLVQCQKNLSTGNEVHSGAVLAFHKQMIALAGQSLDDVQRYQRDISSSTVLVSERTFALLKDLIQNFRKTLLAEAEARSDGDPSPVVYQINLQLFPLTQALESAQDQPSVKEVMPCKNAS